MSAPESSLEGLALASLEELEDGLVAFVQELVRFPSLSGEEGACQARVAEQLEGLGLAVDILECRHAALENHPAFCDDGFDPTGRVDVIGRWAGDGAQRGQGSLVLNGHVDVVPTGDEALWRASPWSGHLAEGRIWGRGSCDMKGGLAAGIYAVAALRRAGIRPAHDILVQSVVGEETGGLGTLTAIEAGYLADAAVILEPTSLHVCPLQSGALTFRIEVSGRSTHAAACNEGVSAIEKFLPLWDAVRALDQRRHQAADQPLYTDPSHIAPISVGTLEAGEWHSTVPGDLIAEGRYGVFPGEQVVDAKRSLEDALAEACHSDSWLLEHPPRLTWFEGQYESGATPLGHPLVQGVTEAHHHVLGADPELRGVTYGSDLRLFTNHAGMPAVLYGPGELREAHSVNESVAVEEILSVARVMTTLLVRWCGGSL